MVCDIKGNKVKIGSKVKVIYIDPKITALLPENEVKDINSMLNEVFEVYEIDEYDGAWVEKWWRRGEGKSESHSLSLSSKDMELVSHT